MNPTEIFVQFFSHGHLKCAAPRASDLHRTVCVCVCSSCAVEQAQDQLRGRLVELNEQAAGVVQGHLAAAVENIISGIRYERLADHGPKMRGLAWKTPLAAP